MPAKSPAQQRLFGMVHAMQKGKLKAKDVSPEVRRLAKSVSEEDVGHFARTRHSDMKGEKDGAARRKSAFTALGRVLMRKTAVDHNVVKGETIYSLARKYGVAQAAILAANGLASPGDLKYGTTLHIPDPVQAVSYAKDRSNPKSQHIITRRGRVVTYPQKAYSLRGPLSDDFVSNLASQLALEVGPNATEDQMKAVLGIAVNRGSGYPGLISSDLASSFWASRPKKGFGRPDIAGDPGYADTVSTLSNLIRNMASSGTPASTDHTMFRHTSGKGTPLPKGFASFPQALTATNQYDSVSGPHLVTYRDATYRHSHPEAKPPKPAGK